MSDLSVLFRFLSTLAKNNNREWFAVNKERYQAAHSEFVGLIGQLIEAISSFDENVSMLEPKKCVFRIYRDVRFSKDKSPYKTNFGASIRPFGRKSPYSGYYLQLQPNNSLVAGGMYHPDAEILGRIRQEIDYNPKAIHQIMDSPPFRKAFAKMCGDKLKRPPKGYTADHPDVELLKHKDFIVYKNIDDKIVTGKQFLKTAVDHYKLIKPLNDFLNAAIDD